MAESTSDKANVAPSTVQSCADSAKSTFQSAIGSLAGSPNGKLQGEALKDQAKAEHDVSKAEHDAYKASISPPGATISTDGGVSKDDMRRTEGSRNQAQGSVKESTGDLVGSESLKQAGDEHKAEGQKQEANGQLGDVGSATAQRVEGTVGAVVLRGDEVDKERCEQMRANGKAQQRGVEAEVGKKGEAEAEADAAM
ncbi:mismatched base pair and cruciform DNA recognition protein [Drechmeria coniospora]|uniref:Mismatched base pair and cruciform DNA recognition protein n=1 Tax=Drechmeria coniospora TaxID=98403 RepID=A0A151GV27_DRECN|nr:mismatched base pair and cruciform DNA recognition protein [Drechmeria coniospora]KYK60966.1 mismatched base pair and cruciform DNA recognition protein [Drechmeria coniospora]ODA83650.1 hypothetical protein RJ55_02165 [Drechmeria coniospora]